MPFFSNHAAPYIGALAIDCLMKALLPLLSLLLLSACDPFGLPENPPDTATYYVSLQVDATTTGAVALAYETPEGLKRDTLVSPDLGVSTSWSQVYDRDALQNFSITATRLTGEFVAVSLLINQETVAFDSSRTEVTLSY